MENRNVKKLREIAKERKIKYYYKMRKDDLIRVINNTSSQRSILSWFVQRPIPAPRPTPVPVQRPIPAPRPVVQRPIPAPCPTPVPRPVPAPRPASVPVQRPVPAQRPISRLTSVTRSVMSYVVDRYTDIIDWIEPYIPEAVKKKVSDTGIKINKKNRVSQVVRIQNSGKNSNGARV